MHARSPGAPFAIQLVLVGLALLAAGALLAAPTATPMKKVVFLAGKKSHGPGDHEYEKGCRLLARCLERSPNLAGFRTEVHLDGWPADPQILAAADTVVVYCDGSDHNEADHPLLKDDRLAQLERAMKRGAGLVLLHYTVFAPVKRGGPEFLEWVGGFFDYETGPGPNHWYSKIQTAATTALPNAAHPVGRGLKPFPLREEYYYQMRFREPDPRRVPLLTTELPNETGPQTVAWAVERPDGGRGFAYTGGHFHSNWENESLRKLILNAVAWTARADVPAEGVQSTVAPQDQPLRALVVTGHQHPAHDWKATTAALQEVLGADPRAIVRVLQDPEQLASVDAASYDLIVLNYDNWQTPSLGAAAREQLLRAVRGGKGLVVVHFANGAWLDWPDYRRLARRTWIEGTSGHDPYGAFRVRIAEPQHPVTRGLEEWETTDELYFKQQGDLPAQPLITARSKVTGQDEPLAFVYEEGGGRVFQLLLGHDAASIRNPGTAALLRRGAAWVARRELLEAAAAGSGTEPTKSGDALVALSRPVSAPQR
jgi:type 1 glutamine amidotransferase